MSDKTFVDTNVLIYAHDVDAGRKHDVAKAVLRGLWVDRTGVRSTQVLQEFYVNAMRSGASRVLSEDLNAGQAIAGVTIRNPFSD